MIETLMYLLEKTKDYSSKKVDIAKGRYKYPENWKEFKRYLKFRYNLR
jgi:hypothetical protein